VKLIVDEAESGALRAFLESRRAPVVASIVAAVEVRRAAKRVRREHDAEEQLAGVTWIELDRNIVEVAARVDPPELRSLDAVHLATALWLRPHVGAFVAYDQRLFEAAAAAGLPAIAPT
jgi:uncharacterized protein